MIRLIPFQYSHLRLIKLQPQQEFLAGAIENAEVQVKTSRPGLAYTAISGGKVLGSAGMVPTWPGRAQVWAMFGCDAVASPRMFIHIHKATKFVLDSWLQFLPFDTLETTVRADYPGGLRWIRKLGFVEQGSIDLYPTLSIELIAFARFRT